MNTMMNAEIASERIRSRSHTPKAGRNRTGESDCPGEDCESGACLFSDSVLGVSGMRLFYCIQIEPSRRRVVQANVHQPTRGSGSTKPGGASDIGRGCF